MNNEEETRIPTTEKLAQALELVYAPQEMITHARAGYYDNFKSLLVDPGLQLIHDARYAGLTDIAERTKHGEFDAQTWEADAWAASPEGQETLGHLVTRNGIPRGPRGPYKRHGQQKGRQG